MSLRRSPRTRPTIHCSVEWDMNGRQRSGGSKGRLLCSENLQNKRLRKSSVYFVVLGSDEEHSLGGELPDSERTQKEINLAVEWVFDSRDVIEMGRKFKSKLQLSLGVTAEVEVYPLIKGIREVGLYHFLGRSIAVVIAAAAESWHLFLSTHSHPPTHTQTHTFTPSKSLGTVPSLGLIFLPEAPGRGGATQAAAVEGKMDYKSGGEWEGKESGNSGLDDARSRFRDSTFKSQLPLEGWVLPNWCTIPVLPVLQ